MVMCVLLEALANTREMCRYVIKEHGVGCVIATGARKKLKLFADSWNMIPHVCAYNIILACVHASCSIYFYFCACLIYIYILYILLDTSYRTASYYGYGSGTIWLNYMQCTGSEDKLLDCDHTYDIGITYCGYNHLAGVFCSCEL